MKLGRVRVSPSDLDQVAGWLRSMDTADRELFLLVQSQADIPSRRPTEEIFAERRDALTGWLKELRTGIERECPGFEVLVCPTEDWNENLQMYESRHTLAPRNKR